MKNNASEKVEIFKRHHGPGHLYFAYHAAFPLVLTPELIYHIWYNFRKDIHDNPFKDQQGNKLVIPWIAMYDLLFSSLCKQVDFDQYELYPEVRNLLLDQLLNNEDLGKQRIIELALFLKNYYEIVKPKTDSDKDSAKTNQLFTDVVFQKEPKVEEKLNHYKKDRNKALQSLIDQLFKIVFDIKKITGNAAEEKIIEKDVFVDIAVTVEEFVKILKQMTDSDTANKIIHNLLQTSTRKGKTVDKDELNNIAYDLVKEYAKSSSSIPLAVATLENQLHTQEKYRPNPTIFIGIGEIGSDVVYGIYHKWMNQYRLEGISNIGFIVCDTDRRIRNKFKETDNFNIVMLPNYFKFNSNRMPDKYKDFLPKPNNIKKQFINLELGANNNREHGHMSFLQSLIDQDSNLEPIENAIKKTLLPNENSLSSQLHVVIVNTLAGGTGAGTFIPFALYVRDYLKNLKDESVRIGFVSFVSKKNERYETQNENEAIDEIKNIHNDNKKHLEKKYGQIINEFDILFDYCCVYTLDKDNRLKLENNPISHTILYQHLSPINDSVFEKKYKAFNNYSFPFCNPLVFEKYYPKEAIENYIKLKSMNTFISTHFPNEEVSRQKLEKIAKTENDPELKQLYMDILNSTKRAGEKSMIYLNKIENKIKEDADDIEEKFSSKQREKGWNVRLDASFLSLDRPAKEKAKFQRKEMKRVHNDLLSYKKFINNENTSYRQRVRNYLIMKDSELSLKKLLLGLNPLAMRIIIYELIVKVNEIRKNTRYEYDRLKKDIEHYENYEKEIIDEGRIDQKYLDYFEREDHLNALKRLLFYQCKEALYEEQRRMNSNYNNDFSRFFSQINEQKKRFERQKQYLEKQMKTNPLESVEKLEFNIQLRKNKTPTFKIDLDKIMKDFLDYSTDHYMGLTLNPIMEKNLINKTNKFIYNNALSFYSMYHKGETDVNIIDAIKQKAEFDNIPVKKRLKDIINRLVRKTQKKGYPSEIFFLMHPECYEKLIKLEINPFDDRHHLYQSDLISQLRIICFCDNYALDMSTDDDFTEKFRQLGTVKRFYSTEKK